MAGRAPVGIPWLVTVGFVRLVTHPAVLEEPLPPKAAIERVRQWFSRERVQSDQLAELARSLDRARVAI
jgi:predicted nucleic acid-binding protein